MMCEIGFKFITRLYQFSARDVNMSLKWHFAFLTFKIFTQFFFKKTQL